MQAESIIVDGREYRVNIIFPSRFLGFEIKEGDNTGQSLSFRKIRDIGGTCYTYRMQIAANRAYQDDFFALFDTLSAPVDSHRVKMPCGQKTLEFDAAIYSGGITDYGKHGEVRRWNDMEIVFEPMEPQRKPGGASWL